LVDLLKESVGDGRVQAAKVLHEWIAPKARVEIGDGVGLAAGVSDIATTALAAGAERGAAVWAGDRDAVAAAATAERSAITDYPFWDDREAAGCYVGLQQ
jgi:hypothetical protein